MSRTRWKLMIGSLGLGLGGLAAIADTPGKPGISCAPATPHVAAKPPTPLPPKVGTDKMPSPPAIPAAPPMMAMELPALPAAAKAEPPVPPMPVMPLPTPPSANDSPKPLALPAMPAAGEGMTTPGMPALKPEVPALPSLPAMPKAEPFQRKNVTLVTPDGTAVEMTPANPLVARPESNPPMPPKPDVESVVARGVSVLPRPASEAAKPTASTPDEARPSHDTGEYVLPKGSFRPALSEVKPVSVSVTPARAEKKLQVLLHMGDERPKFEVRDGEVVYLRVTSEKVDVKSPADSVEANLSTMRATGKVRFVTPGGEGTCDDLSVVPGSGQVTVMGHVAFTYSWGKVETTVTGEKMTFRLGDAPAGSR